MLNEVWKFQLDVDSNVELTMQKGAKILHVGPGAFMVYIWALVDPDAETEKRQFVVVGTGRHFDAEKMNQYIGTAEINSFVWHVFERGGL